MSFCFLLPNPRPHPRPFSSFRRCSELLQVTRSFPRPRIIGPRLLFGRDLRKDEGENALCLIKSYWWKCAAVVPAIGGGWREGKRDSDNWSSVSARVVCPDRRGPINQLSQQLLIDSAPKPLLTLCKWYSHFFTRLRKQPRVFSFLSLLGGSFVSEHGIRHVRWHDYDYKSMTRQLQWILGVLGGWLNQIHGR